MSKKSRETQSSHNYEHRLKNKNRLYKNIYALNKNINSEGFRPILSVYLLKGKIPETNNTE